MGAEDNALISLDDLKIYLKESGGDHDSVLSIIINSVSTDFEGHLGRTLRQATYTDLYLDGNGEKTLFLPDWPVDSITSLEEDEEALTEGIDEDYILYADDGYIVRNGAWLEGNKTIKITYKAGYTTIPKDVQLACLKWCAWEFQNYDQKRWGETSRTYPEAGAVTTIEEAAVWKEIKRVINKYRRFVL